MSYLGNRPATGENNSFKILDDITSYTLTFDGSSASVVSLVDDTITEYEHRFITGQRIVYNTTGTAIGGLTSSTEYYIIKNDQNTFKLAASLAKANNNDPIDLNTLGTGTTHTINVAFDGVNTKFKATYDNGTKAAITRAAQLQLSINGVIQQPNDTSAPVNGFGFDLDSVIVFSTPPLVTDVFWGNLVANNFPTFDIADNSVDTFTGDGSTVSFTLSKAPVNNQNVLVTLDGVVQYPSDNYTVRAYSVSENVITFVGAPGNGVDIQVRHIGFAGATSSNVTGFYGRTGNVGLTTADRINIDSIDSVGNINSSGIITAVSFIGTATTAQGLTTTASVNTTGIITATGGIQGIGIQSGGFNIATGIITALNFVGAGNTFSYNSSSKTVDINIGGSQWTFVDASVPATSSIYRVNGNVGLGTTNPTQKLDVVGNVEISGSVGINTANISRSELTGIGNSFNGVYVSNGMIVMDNTLNGNHYIGTNFNGLMAGPVNVNGSVTVDGVWVVV